MRDRERLAHGIVAREISLREQAVDDNHPLRTDGIAGSEKRPRRSGMCMTSMYSRPAGYHTARGISAIDAAGRGPTQNGPSFAPWLNGTSAVRSAVMTPGIRRMSTIS